MHSVEKMSRLPTVLREKQREPIQVYVLGSNDGTNVMLLDLFREKGKSSDEEEEDNAGRVPLREMTAKFTHRGVLFKLVRDTSANASTDRLLFCLFFRSLTLVITNEAC